MSHDIDDTYKVYDEREPTARKAHVCMACGETIRRGDKYVLVGIVPPWRGESAHTVIRCLRCQKLHEHLRDLGHGETWPAEKLDCGETYESHWNKPPPEEIAALAFVTPDEAQTRWGTP